MTDSDLERELLYEEAFEEQPIDTEPKEKGKRHLSNETKENRRRTLEKARAERKRLAEERKKDKEQYDRYEFKDMKVSKPKSRKEEYYSDDDTYSEESDYSDYSPPPKKHHRHKKEPKMTKQEEKLMKMEKIVYGLLKAQKEATKMRTVKKPKPAPVNYTTVVNVPKSNDTNKVKLPLDLFNR